MWRLTLAATLLLTLASGGLAAASPPPIVLESVTIHDDPTATTLRFTARFESAFDPGSFPETGAAVVMQQDGQRSKCINVPLTLDSVNGGVATYVGRLPFRYQNASVLSGRADVGGSIYDFSGRIDGTPGTLEKSSASSVSSNGAAPVTRPVVITAAPVSITPESDAARARAAIGLPAATAEALAATQRSGAAATRSAGDLDPVALLGLIVILATALGAYVDRRRSLARAAAG